MVEPDFQLLGERIERIQAELRELRGVRADVAHLRAEVSQLRSDLIQMRSEMGQMRSDMSQAQAESGDRHESLSVRVDNLERAMDARFTQVQETMATNLAIVLDAIRTR